MRSLIYILVVSLALSTSAMANTGAFVIPGMVATQNHNPTNNNQQNQERQYAVPPKRQSAPVRAVVTKVQKVKNSVAKAVNRVNQELQAVKPAMRGASYAPKAACLLATLCEALSPAKVRTKAKVLQGKVILRHLNKDLEADLVGSGTPLTEANPAELMMLHLNSAWEQFVTKVEALNQGQVANNRITEENVVISNGQYRLADWRGARKASVAGFGADIAGLKRVKKYLQDKMNE